MKGVWGLSTSPNVFSDKSKALFKDTIVKCRSVFSKEFAHALEDYHYYMLHKGRRYFDNDKIYWALVSNFTESDFLDCPEHCIMRVLVGACSSDYYYTYEKEW